MKKHTAFFETRLTVIEDQAKPQHAYKNVAL